MCIWIYVILSLTGNEKYALYKNNKNLCKIWITIARKLGWRKVKGKKGQRLKWVMSVFAAVAIVLTFRTLRQVVFSYYLKQSYETKVFYTNCIVLVNLQLRFCYNHTKIAYRHKYILHKTFTCKTIERGFINLFL